MRQRAKAQQQLRELGEQVGVTDPELSRELAELGFTLETVKLLPLIPVLEMAWAEGGVTDAERKMVVDARTRARDRGRKHGGPSARGLARSATRGQRFPPRGEADQRPGRVGRPLRPHAGRHHQVLRGDRRRVGRSLRDSARLVRGTCDAQSHRERDQEPAEVARVTRLRRESRRKGASAVSDQG